MGSAFYGSIAAIGHFGFDLLRGKLQPWSWAALLILLAFCALVVAGLSMVANRSQKATFVEIDEQSALKAAEIAQSTGDDWNAQVWLAQKHGIDDGVSLWLLRWLKGEPVPKSIVIELLKG